MARRAGHRRWRRSVHQRGFLLSGTVVDNIRFGRPEATRAEVEAAARAVGADRVIAGLADGYDTQVGELDEVTAGSWPATPTPSGSARLRDPALVEHLTHDG